jgi:AraC-like DNA-binding protein/mannose-6-phosphate isomerase-like protein (cupin superfamily)
MDLAIETDSQGAEKLLFEEGKLSLITHIRKLSLYHEKRVMPHWHNDYEFAIVRQGSMFYNVNGKDYLLSKGEGLFVDAKAIHYCHADGGEDCLYIYAIFPPLALSFLKPTLGQGPFSMGCDAFLLSSEDPSQKQVIDDIYALYSLHHDESDSGLLFSSALMFHILGLLKKIIPEEKKKKEDPSIPYLKAMLHFLNSNYDREILLSDVAGAAHISPSSADNYFRHFLHLSPKEYQIKLRVSKARELLAKTEATIEEIGFQTGFNSASFFIRTYKKETGETPLESRKKALRASL